MFKPQRIAAFSSDNNIQCHKIEITWKMWKIQVLKKEKILEYYGHILFCVNTHQAVLINLKIGTKCCCPTVRSEIIQEPHLAGFGS